jgi:hypothetical protein
MLTKLGVELRQPTDRGTPDHLVLTTLASTKPLSRRLARRMFVAWNILNDPLIP